MGGFTNDAQIVLGSQPLLAAALAPPPAFVPAPPPPAQASQKKAGGRKSKDGKVKRARAKKPVDAPRRPKSAYMFFLAEFREKWKTENPDSKRVSEVAVAAGDTWRDLSASERAVYEEKSRASKDAYKDLIAEYEKEHPKPLARVKKERAPGELKRPQSAYFFFLAVFREQFKEQHKGEVIPVSVVGKAAGEKWKQLTPEERRPYEDLSTASKNEYARMKMLTPAERMMVAAAARMQQQDDMERNGSKCQEGETFPDKEHTAPQQTGIVV